MQQSKIGANDAATTSRGETGNENIQLGPAGEKEEHRRMSKASTATGGADEPGDVNGGETEMSEGFWLFKYLFHT